MAKRTTKADKYQSCYNCEKSVSEKKERDKYKILHYNTTKNMKNRKQRNLANVKAVNRIWD